MDNTAKYALGAFVGWLLVQISGTVEGTLHKLIGWIDPIRFLPNLLGILIATIGWVATVFFSFHVLKTAWKTFRNQ
ncbi:hypothetical protein [Paenibacillus sp. Soil522]|uniref:hypothetical protein n=1 Tax=Paenibacillus sp. Soil522 TaxID=1736388 RepID=UPI0006FF3072|nr:hypothetical protein [Paenibacillus sp. Soil522]KRE54459.1 hypothetical protein ASG81_01755 [Paenibacillus sp. Soil522]